MTLNLNVDSCVANAHIVTGLPQSKGVNPTYCQMYIEIKYVKNVSCAGHLSSVNLVNNAPHAVIDPPVGARLHQCWEKWEALGSSPKPNNRWRPVLDLSTLNTFLNTRSFKMETPETTFHRLQRRILPYTNSQSVQEVHAFSSSGSVLPVQSPTLWSIHSSHGVHSGGQRGRTHGTSEGYKDPPVPRRLAGESLYPRHLSPANTNLSDPLSGTRVAGEKGEVRTGSQTGFQLRRLPVRPERGQG